MSSLFCAIIFAMISVSVSCPELLSKYASKSIYPCKCVSQNDDGLDIVCEKTNLAILSIGLLNVASVRDTVITNLTIRHCVISRLYGDLFYSLSAKRLTLQDMPLIDLDSDLFLGLGKSLKELYVHSNDRGNIRTVTFTKWLVNLSVLSVDKHRIGKISTDTFESIASRATLERLTITNGLTSLVVEPNSFESLRKLKFLSLRGNDIKELKRNQFKGLVELESIDVSFNSIGKIDASHFADLTKLIRCNISRNVISNLPRGAFARNTLLRVLDLSGNRLTKIDGNIFKGLRMLSRLYLNDNQITDVERATFNSISRIRTVNMARNKLKKVDYQTFHELLLIEIIDLSENAIVYVEKLAFKSLYLVNIDLSANNISLIEKGAFEMCVNITKLDVSKNRLKTLLGAFDETTYAMELQLSRNEFEDLSNVPLSNMTGLKVLNVTDNKLKIIPKNTFSKLYELHTIDLSRNFIDQVASEVFQPLLGLRYLYMNDNFLQQLNSRIFGKIFTLLELHLQRNRISRIKNDVFIHLISLRILNLNDNVLEELFEIPVSLSELNLRNNSVGHIASGKVWPSMNTLTSLDLSSNYLGDSFEKGTFTNLLVLQRLDLSDNRITTVPKDSLENFSSLRAILMTGNSLTELEQSAFGNLPVLFELNLSDNAISNIHNAAFATIPQLRTLNLARNNLSNLSGETFKRLYILEELDLAENNLNALTIHINTDDRSRRVTTTISVFEECWSLKKLNVSRNVISYLNKNSFPIRSPLHTIDLSGNKLFSFSDRPFHNRIRHLNLSENAIDEIPSNLLENLTSLISLDLSGNLLTTLDTNVLPTTIDANLTYLYAKNNRINTLKFKRDTTAKFRIIDLRDNSLTSVYDPLIELLKNGTKIFYGRNPILCSCNVRLLRRWLSRRSRTEYDDWSDFVCYDFQTDTNLTVVNVKEYDIWCDSVTLRSSSGRYDLPPDVDFRSVKTEGNRILISWYVVEDAEDIADFLIEIRDDSNYNAIYSKNLSYVVRKDYVNRAIITTSMDNAKVCLTTKNSLGILRNRTVNQCRSLTTLLTNEAVVSSYYSDTKLFVCVWLISLYASFII